MLLYIFSVGVSGQSSGIKNELIINQLSLEEGLRQSMVKEVLQDCRGLVWMTTGDGLHLHDGKRFSVFKVPEDSLFSPFDNLMRTFAEVNPNRFAIASKTALLHFDSEMGSFKTIARVNDSKIFKLLPQKTTIAWMHDLGFAVLEDTTLHPISLNIEGNSIPLMFTPTRICSYSNKTMVIGTEGLIEIYGIPSSSTKKLKAKYYNRNFSDMLVDSKGELLLLGDGIIHKYLGNGKTEINFNTNQKDINLFFGDKQCNLWLVNNSKKSLHILKDSAITAVNLIAKQGRLKEEIRPYILSFFEDYEGSIWFGTDGHGVLQLQTNLLQFLRADIGFVRSICSSNKSVYVGTFQNGIHKISTDLKNIDQIDFKDLNLTNELLDIEIDCNKRLWVATANQIFVANLVGNVVYKKEIKTLRGNLLKLENGVIQYYTDSCFYEFSSRSSPSLLSQRKYMYITSLVNVYGKGWVGTPFGLFAIEKWDENSTYHYPADKMLTSYPINEIRRNAELIWVATSHGLMLFDSTSKRIELPSELSILKNENIYSLEIDNQNRLWISTNIGIGCIPAELDRIIWFDAKNNLQSLEFNSKASLWANNMLYFGGINGINAINPNSFKPKPNRGKPLLVQFFNADSCLTKGIPSNKITLKLRWDKSSIRGRVASASYIAQNNQRYSFYLENFHSTWAEPNSTGEFSYPNLPSGKYLLKVIFSDAYGIWSEPVELVSLSITPPYWKTKWFIASISLIILTITGLIVQQVQRKRFLKKIDELERQNALDRERGRISRDLHDELGTGLSLIMLNTSLASNAESNEMIKKHLSTISKNSKELYDNMSNLVWLLKSESQTLDYLSSRIREKMSEILDDAGFDYAVNTPDDSDYMMVTREASRQIFLSVKEAVNNAIRHSKGNRVEINIYVNGNTLHLNICDNGIGFSNGQSNGKGNGLSNISQRAFQLGGTFMVESYHEVGTKVSMVLPLNSLTNP